MPRNNAIKRPGAMSARAMLATELASNARSSRVKILRSQAPLALRPTHPKGAEPLTHRERGAARVALAAGAAGPLGGDDFILDVHVGAGSTLVLNEIAAMLVLPGPRGERSRMRISVNVDEDATFVWLPEPVIAARDCNHQHSVHVRLAPGARMVMREEAILGRYREQPGNLCNQLRVEYNGFPLYHQQLRFGPDAKGWNSPAVVGNNQALGSIIAVDPFWADETPGASAFHPQAVVAPLPGPGMVVSAVAPDSLALRRLLHHGLDELGAPWSIRENSAPVRASHHEDNVTQTEYTEAGCI